LSTGEILGFTAGALVTLSYFPQLIRIFRLKSAHEISLSFTILMVVGISTWLAYGFYFHLAPVILWNLIGGAQAVAMLYAKLKYGRQ
jgi:MtN3 and saliva related transmembrane protein